MTSVTQSFSDSPRPADLSGSTVVVLHAHPDDEAIFTGATMRRLADAGARVVLVTATAGELGEVLVPLAAGESIASRRQSELEHAAEILGVSRLVLLGHRDSGLPGWLDNDHPNALVAADLDRLVGRVTAIARQEGAEAIVHYDSQGVYSHPDHVAVHNIGRVAASRLGITAYESTVDREHLHVLGDDSHLVYAASRATASPFGQVRSDIGLVIEAGDAELAAKRAAITAHESQISPGALDHAAFADAYRYEWYLRDGAESVLDWLNADRQLAELAG